MQKPGAKSIGNLDSKLIVGIERAYFENMEFPRTYGRGALPLKPSKSEEARGTNRSELLTFTDLSPNDIDRVTQMVGFERMLNGAYSDVKGANNIDDWIVTNRQFFEQYRPEVLSQVLARAMMSEPDSLKTYHPETDSLLLALHHPTAKGRVGQKIWKAEEKVRHRLPFNEWRVSPRLNMTPRTQEAVRSGVDLESILMRRLTTHTMQLFPADHATVCLRSMGKPVGDAVEAGAKPDGIVGGSHERCVDYRLYKIRRYAPRSIILTH